MNLSFYIAKRYLFAKKSRNIINVITAISVIVIAFVTTAMIIILSAFNGIDELVQKLYSSLDADITIAPAKGKTIDTSRFDLEKVKTINAIDWIEAVVEDNVILSYRDKQRIARLKGVTDQYLMNINFHTHIREGYAQTEIGDDQYGILGYGVNQELAAGLYNDTFIPLTVYAPRRGKKLYKNREGATNRKKLMNGGVFSINLDFDTKYVISSLNFAKDLLGLENEVSHYEVKLFNKFNPDLTKKQLMEILGPDYKVSTQKEKNSLIYKANESERMITIYILAFIVLIATFNVFSSLTILIIDKTKDRKTLISLGATESTIRNIFFIEGLMLSAMGTIIGLILGFILSGIQQQYGIIPLEGGIVDYYPVIMKVKDFFMVAAIVMGIGFMFSWLPVYMLTRKSK